MLSIKRVQNGYATYSDLYVGQNTQIVGTLAFIDMVEFAQADGHEKEKIERVCPMLKQNCSVARYFGEFAKMAVHAFVS